MPEDVRDNAAYMQGYADFLAEQYVNPYRPDTDAYEAWAQGFDDAAEDN